MADDFHVFSIPVAHHVCSTGDNGVTAVGGYGEAEGRITAMATTRAEVAVHKSSGGADGPSICAATIAAARLHIVNMATGGFYGGRDLAHERRDHLPLVQVLAA